MKYFYCSVISLNEIEYFGGKAPHLYCKCQVGHCKLTKSL